MNTEEVEGQLSQLEAQLALLSSVLSQNDANEIMATSMHLHSMTVTFSKILPQVTASLQGNLATQLRIRKINALIGWLREGLMRHSVGVDRALAALVPATQNNTYTPRTGIFARQTYGSAGRQSGEFRTISA
jgi:hypothetical protein